MAGRCSNQGRAPLDAGRAEWAVGVVRACPLLKIRARLSSTKKKKGAEFLTLDLSLV